MIAFEEKLNRERLAFNRRRNSMTTAIQEPLNADFLTELEKDQYRNTMIDVLALLDRGEHHEATTKYKDLMKDWEAKKANHDDSADEGSTTVAQPVRSGANEAPSEASDDDHSVPDMDNTYKGDSEPVRTSDADSEADSVDNNEDWPHNKAKPMQVRLPSKAKAEIKKVLDGVTDEAAKKVIRPLHGIMGE